MLRSALIWCRFAAFRSDLGSFCECFPEVNLVYRPFTYQSSHSDHAANDGCPEANVTSHKSSPLRSCDQCELAEDQSGSVCIRYHVTGQTCLGGIVHITGNGGGRGPEGKVISPSTVGRPGPNRRSADVPTSRTPRGHVLP